MMMMMKTTVRRLLPLRFLSTGAPSSSCSARGPRLDPGPLSFQDPGAFRVKSTKELLRALAVFRFCSIPLLVNNCDKLLTVARGVLGRRGLSLLLRPFVYAQFVAGETEGEISRSMTKMADLGLRPMLAVPLEEDLGESTGEQRYEENMASMLECVRLSHSNTWTTDPMMQLKITALLSPELCVKLTELLKHQTSVDLEVLLRGLNGEPIRFPGLDERENAHLLCGLKRLNTIAVASVHKVRVLVDAEYTYMNPALSLVTMAMMKKFNQGGVWIWNTYQCYLKEARGFLQEALDVSSREGFSLGVKLVRGAYMDKERRQAEKEDRPDPVHDSWENTNHSYNGNMELLMDLISQDPQRYRVIIATHNEESVRRTVQRIEELGVDKGGGSVCFGQLLGMCDHVSLTLAEQGYAVYKSVPYGSVEDTMPYLVRRAQENRTVLQGIRKERDLLRLELHRRMRLGRGAARA
ncbi:hydroxyproline dehydrogenase isoform X2 [Gadus chalcogrammus]|nr:hydroxyproline dehydrogenase isoform X2 [Gadus chalcogrammus]XP_056433074.1 hydroxyproline dehydrogenase isoform X2 [Gadus chalcogrammus]XP_056433075.1 hydroxyproline dehydrogenase isoform X2 [Gadus chalcogrammus]XP_056433076.1 hydroxyproline dehydrogenase isoform X2 [Gadus chalcogrammus]